MESASSSPKHAIDSVSAAAITAAAIAAVSISAGVRRRTRLARADVRSQRRRNKSPGSHRQTGSDLSHPVPSSSSESCSESKPCLYCLETLTETRGNGPPEVKVECPVCVPFPQCLEEHLPEQPCPIHDQLPVNHQHDCCCDHPASSLGISATRNPDACCSDLPSAKYTSRPIGAGTQRMRRSSLVSNCQKMQSHPTQVVNARRSSSAIQKVKMLKTAKSREQRVQARRIRHPSEDSSSDSELEAPNDVRAGRPGSSSLPQPPSPSKQRSYPPCSSKRLHPVSSSSIATKPVYSSGTTHCIQGTPCTIPSANPNVYRCCRPTKHLPSSSSSDSSSTSDHPRSVSSTSTSSYSCTDLSDTSTSNNNTPNHYSYSSQYHTALRNPYHTCYHGPHEGPSSSRGSSLPVSSGDFWNVRRAYTRNRSADYGQCPEGPCCGSRITRDTGSHLRDMESTWRTQRTIPVPSMFHPRNIKKWRNDT